MSESALRASALRGVALPARGGKWDVRIEDGRIAAVEPSFSPPSGQLALPAFREPHLHADRAYALAPRTPTSLQDAIEMADELRARSTAEDVLRRARRVFSRAAAHGALSVRTHVDHAGGEEDKGRRGVAAAAAELDGMIDVEIVAFASATLDPVTTEAHGRLVRALEDGAQVLGAFVGLNPDPAASLDALLDLAAQTGAPVDVHLDEHLDADASMLGHLAEATIARGLEGRVTASHCCALSALTRSAADRVVARVAAAGITVIALPALNLYLQDRRGGTPRVRGITLVHELLEAGVAVRFGSDNVRDVFFPYGDADPLEAAFLASLGGHVDDERLLLAGICGGREELAPGDAADLVLIPADSLPDALALRPGGRTLLRAGVPVAV